MHSSILFLYKNDLHKFCRGNELKCTLWGVFAQQFNDFLKANVDHGKIMIVLQLAMMKVWTVTSYHLSYYK